MKHFSLVAYHFFIFSLLSSVLVICQEFQQSISYVQHIPIQPLSEKEKVFFEQQNYVSSVYRLEQHPDNHYIGHSGQLSVTGTLGNCSTTVGTDLLSIITLIPALAEYICRLIDINNHYYRQDVQESLEQILYGVDRARYKIYSNVQQSVPLLADAQYLQIKIYELEIQKVAHGRKTAISSAAQEAYETLLRSLRYIESQCFYTPEQKYQVQHAALTHAIKVVEKITFKRRKDKYRLLDKYQEALADATRHYRIYQAAVATQQAHAKELQKQQYVQNVFNEQLPLLEEVMEDSVFYAAQVPFLATVYEKRTEVFDQSRISAGIYRTEKYTVSDDIQKLLKEHNASIDTFTRCYGSNYQHCLHQESVAVLEQTNQLTIGSVLYQHQHTLITFAEVAAEYNHAGECYKSVPLLDFCWTLLSWRVQVTEGVVEGAVLGMVGAVTDIIQHPVQAGVSVVLGSSVMLTYQLSKIIYTVADLSITTIVNPAAGQQKWDSYLEPLHQILDAIDKKKIGLKETSRAATQFGVQWYTQAKLLGGLRNLYDGIQIKVALFFSNNQSIAPEQYLATPDGQLLKIAINAPQSNVLLNHGGETSSSLETFSSRINTLDKLSDAVFVEAFKHATTKNSLFHFFQKKHNFTPLLEKLMSEENVVYEVLKASEGALPINGLFKDIPVNVHGFTVYVRGSVIDGIPRLATMFIK